MQTTWKNAAAKYVRNSQYSLGTRTDTDVLAGSREAVFHVYLQV